VITAFEPPVWTVKNDLRHEEEISWKNYTG